MQIQGDIMNVLNSHVSSIFMKKTLPLFILFFLAFIVAILPTQVSAATLTVNLLTDDGDGTCDGTCTFRDAVDDAVDGDVIEFGDLEGTILLDGSTSISFDYNIDINGPGADVLTIDFNNDSNNSIYTSNDGELNISGLTFSNTSTFELNGQGDSVYNFSNLVFDGHNDNDFFYLTSSGEYNGSYNFDNVTFSDITTTSNGGAIYYESSGDLTITNSTFTNNQFQGVGSRGGAAITVDIGTDGNITISDSTFSDNSSATDGGAIYTEGDGNLTITDSTFSNNTASGGGSGGAISFDSLGDLTITNSIFSTNTAGYRGGAIYINGDNAYIYDTSFSGNYSDGNDGSVLYINDETDVDIFNSTFDSNLGGYGVVYHNGGKLNITNSTFSNNDSEEAGYSAGIYGGNAEVNIINSTFYNNINGDYGSAFTLSGYNFDVLNSIISGEKNCEDTPTSLGHNIDSGNTCGFAEEGDLSSTNPLLDPDGLQDNGGDVETIALLENSPAIDAGDDEQAPETDARGISRPQREHSDIGAFELEPARRRSSSGSSAAYRANFIVKQALLNTPPATVPPTTPSQPTHSPEQPTCNGTSITSTLKQGMINPEVKCLQQYLNTHNFPVSLIGPGSLGLETNFFGPKTKAAVILFQKAKGLTPDGIVGPKTKAMLI
jgi:predicted outer membrane repeat protein